MKSFLSAIVALSGSALAAPTPDAVKQVWDFYYDGEGVVLADATVCIEVAKDGEDKNNCRESAPPEGVDKGTTISIWQAYIVADEVVEDLAVQSKHNGVVRQTRDVTVKGGFRYRTWSSFRLSKTGTWTFNILKGSDVLETLSVTVN